MRINIVMQKVISNNNYNIKGLKKIKIGDEVPTYILIGAKDQNKVYNESSRENLVFKEELYCFEHEQI